MFRDDCRDSVAAFRELIQTSLDQLASEQPGMSEFALLLGAGWAASETVAFSSPNAGHVAFRSGPRTYLGLVVLQRIFVTMNVDFYPIKDTGDGYRDDFVDDWEFNLTAGWRFLD